MVHDASEGKSKVRVATVTISDTRTSDNDEGGATLRRLLEAAGADLGPHHIVKDELRAIREAVLGLCAQDGIDAVVTTGGTGIAPRDQTYEAIEGLLEKRLDGFGEAFRRLSWDAIGPRAILSRAIAGTVRDRVVVALPGSPRAIALAVETILGPVLPHAVALTGGRSGHHG